jgi:hypothetical protein
MAPHGFHGSTNYAAFFNFNKMFWTGAKAQAGGEGAATPIHQHQEWTRHLKNTLSGDNSPYIMRGMLWPCPAGLSQTTVFNVINLPIILVSDNGKKRHWGMIRQAWPSTKQQQLDMGLRDYQSLKSSPVPVTVVCSDTGRIMSQNTASMALIGKVAGHQCYSFQTQMIQFM